MDTCCHAILYSAPCCQCATPASNRCGIQLEQRALSSQSWEQAMTVDWAKAWTSWGVRSLTLKINKQINKLEKNQANSTRTTHQKQLPNHWQGVFRSSKSYINHQHDAVTSNLRTPCLPEDNQNEKSKFSPKLSALTFNCVTSQSQIAARH